MVQSSKHFNRNPKYLTENSVFASAQSLGPLRNRQRRILVHESSLAKLANFHP